MMRCQRWFVVGMCCIFWVSCESPADERIARRLTVCPPDAPAAPTHLEQFEIFAAPMSLEELFSIGQRWFKAPLNTCDGQGRPTTTGQGAKRSVVRDRHVKGTGPDSTSCFGCHAQPRIGGGGDFVANAAVFARGSDEPGRPSDFEFSNERNTLGMFGSGPIEMLAREMSVELRGQADSLPDGDHILRAKTVEFPITLRGGRVVAAQGIDTDLVVKPFHQAGVVVSLREFTVNAFNQHHGIQPEERFDLNTARGMNPDFDEDGVSREMTVGDVTAVTLFQAALGTPVQKLPWDENEQADVRRGETLFREVGCARCHVPWMELDSPYYTEPSPFNPQGTFNDQSKNIRFDMTKEGQLPRLETGSSGKAVVRAYTDLKRHNLCDPPGLPNAVRFFCNEEFDHGRPMQDGRPGSEFFLTRKLWDVGNSAPYGHRGDITTISEAIYHHAGEARTARDSFLELSVVRQSLIVDFLKTLKVPAIPFDCNGDGQMDSQDLVGAGCFRD